MCKATLSSNLLTGNQLTSVCTHNHIPRHYRFLVFQESIFCNFCSEVSHEYNQLGSLDKDVCIL